MSQQHTSPHTDQRAGDVNVSSDWRRELADHWQSMVDSDDPARQALGRRMQQRWKEAQRPIAPRVDDGRPAPWAHVLDAVTGARIPTGNPNQFKGGHDYAHPSKSGTCVSVDLGRGVWYCSSCRTGGTAATWIMQQNDCSYLVAARILIEKFGEADGH